MISIFLLIFLVLKSSKTLITFLPCEIPVTQGSHLKEGSDFGHEDLPPSILLLKVRRPQEKLFDCRIKKTVHLMKLYKELETSGLFFP